MTISSEIGGKVILENKFLCADCRKVVGKNSILCQFCRCLVHKRFSDIRGKLKENSKFKMLYIANQQTYLAEDYCPGIKLNC